LKKPLYAASVALDGSIIPFAGCCCPDLIAPLTPLHSIIDGRSSRLIQCVNDTYPKEEISMATLILTDEQVVELVLQLPPDRKRRILEALKAKDDEIGEPDIVEKEGLLVVCAPLLSDISHLVEQGREARVAELLAKIKLPGG
jgi:hypothetical protein